MSIRLGPLLLGIFFPFLLLAQEPDRRIPKPDQSGEETALKEAVSGVTVKKISENLYRLGEIEFNAKTREIRIPVVVNMREGGPMEYLLVHETGKVHESILATAVSPMHYQIVMKLLRYRAGRGDVFNPFLRPEALKTEGGKEANRGETVRFEFQPEGKEAIPAYELVIDGESAEAMTPGGWVFTGSAVEGGTFMAEAEGSIVAIYLDPLALFNMTREGAEIDARWGARHSVIPEIGTKGILSMRPESPPETKSE